MNSLIRQAKTLAFTGLCALAFAHSSAAESTNSVSQAKSNEKNNCYLAVALERTKGTNGFNFELYGTTTTHENLNPPNRENLTSPPALTNKYMLETLDEKGRVMDLYSLSPLDLERPVAKGKRAIILCTLQSPEEGTKVDKIRLYDSKREKDFIFKLERKDTICSEHKK